MTITLSESLEDYLEAIAELISVEGHAHTKDIARKLGVKMPSVTGALRALVEKGLIEYNANYPVVLTPLGRQTAEKVMLRHRILGRFFVEILGLPLQKGSDIACHMEHVIDDDTVERFVLFSKALESRQDANALKIYLTEACELLRKDDGGSYCVLSELSVGDRAEIHGYSRNIQGKNLNLPEKGSIVMLDGISLDKTRLSLMTSSGRMELDLAVAENVWVKALDSGAEEK